MLLVAKSAFSQVGLSVHVQIVRVGGDGTSFDERTCRSGSTAQDGDGLVPVLVRLLDGHTYEVSHRDITYDDYSFFDPNKAS